MVRETEISGCRHNSNHGDNHFSDISGRIKSAG
jgi:hypothetical protein